MFSYVCNAAVTIALRLGLAVLPARYEFHFNISPIDAEMEFYGVVQIVEGKPTTRPVQSEPKCFNYMTSRTPLESAYPLPLLLAENDPCVAVLWRGSLLTVLPGTCNSYQSAYYRGVTRWAMRQGDRPVIGLPIDKEQAVRVAVESHMTLERFVETFGPPNVSSTQASEIHLCYDPLTPARTPF